VLPELIGSKGGFLFFAYGRQIRVLPELIGKQKAVSYFLPMGGKLGCCLSL
jgi:hypothetical protein